jgi:hypothetical protein
MDEACPGAPDQNRVRRMDLGSRRWTSWHARVLGRGTNHPKSGRCRPSGVHVPLARDKQSEEHQHHEHPGSEPRRPSAPPQETWDAEPSALEKRGRRQRRDGGSHDSCRHSGRSAGSAVHSWRGCGRGECRAVYHRANRVRLASERHCGFRSVARSCSTEGQFIRTTSGGRTLPVSVLAASIKKSPLGNTS